MCRNWAGLNINIAPCTGDGEVRHDVVEPVELDRGSGGDEEVRHDVVEPVELDRDSGDLTSWSTAIEVKMLDATV